MTAKGVKEEIRSFIAIDLPPAFLEAIGSLQDELKTGTKGIRWVKSGNIHLTLKFLGDVPSELLDELGEILASVCRGHAPLELSPGTPGGFPSLERPRVIWLGLEGELEELETLKQEIEKGCSSAGLPREKRSFHPHLTLGRVKNWRKASATLADLFGRTKAVSAATFTVKAVHLYRSDLTRDGAVYTKLKSFPLKQEK
jgi:2'-5' RNA ligase